MSLTSVNLTTLADELLLPDGTSFSLTGDPTMAALSNSSLAGFSSTAANSFLILSSGIAGNTTDANSAGNQGTDMGDSGVDGDSITLAFTVTAPENADSFSFSFSFLSEEYPEYVGSSYNDFFSATVNGTEVALDLNANPISVNNDFFSDTLSPVGTFYDGQTPPLVVATDVNGGDTITVQFQVADAGDGIYDSAAFIGDFSFNQDQVVFVDFNYGAVKWPAMYDILLGLFTVETEVEFNLPGSGVTATDQAGIIASLNTIYDDYNVEFTSTMPTSGDYSTVHVGGEVADVPAWLNVPANLYGLATSIDYGNQDQNDDAFVLSDEIREGLTWDADELALLTQVIAHESGHIFGLRHVNENTALMYPFAGAGTAISDGAPFGEINQDTHIVENIGGDQNSQQELARNLGLDGAQILVSQESVFDQFLNFFNFSMASTSGGGGAATVYNALAVIFTDSGEEEGLTILSLVDLGTISDGGDASFVLPALSDDQVVILGSSTEDGALDVVLSDGGLTNIDFDSLGLMGTLAALGVAVEALDSTSLSFSEVDDDGGLTQFASVAAAVLDVSDTPATEGADSITGDASDDTIVGLGGDDTLSGEEGNDNLLGGTGDDVLQGADGDDALNGGDGDDFLGGGAGNDVLLGGTGADNIAASTGNDSVDGGSGNDSIGGGEGNDTLSGGSGNDVIGSGVGNDIANGGVGNDGVFGGAGDDTLSGGAGDDNMGGSFGADNLDGGTGNDDMGGGTGTDTILGGDGNDTVGGGEGDDVIDGGTGDDFLAGGGRHDMIDGGSGDDRINAGNGDDTITGGDGADVFIFNGFNAGDADVITDWTNGEDTFRMSGITGAPGSGLAGKLAALNATNVADGVQLSYEGHTILLEGASAADLGLEDFTFV
ncbi:choice-of-anchor L domain-containing protein [Rhodobacteraceae bacterium LMO-12]|nr:choice-of-anchor L domain-containing protein [Rhodobacteraceae bacterium LMO-JJ12]